MSTFRTFSLCSIALIGFSGCATGESIEMTEADFENALLDASLDIADDLGASEQEMMAISSDLEITLPDGLTMAAKLHQARKQVQNMMLMETCQIRGLVTGHFRSNGGFEATVRGVADEIVGVAYGSWERGEDDVEGDIWGYYDEMEGTNGSLGGMFSQPRAARAMGRSAIFDIAWTPTESVEDPNAELSQDGGDLVGVWLEMEDSGGVVMGYWSSCTDLPNGDDPHGQAETGEGDPAAE